MLAQTTDFLAFNAGNLITLVCLVGGAIAGWQKISDRLDSHDKRMKVVEFELGKLAERGVPALCALHAERLARIEQQIAQQVQQMAQQSSIIVTVANDVQWIKQSMQQTRKDT